MRKEIMKWLKKHATIAQFAALLAFCVGLFEFARDIQQDLDEVRYSRQINEIEKKHAKEIEEYRLKVFNLREENLKLKMDQLQSLEQVWGKTINNSLETEVAYENK